jgi:flagellar biosynthesis protein FlhA
MAAPTNTGPLMTASELALPLGAVLVLAGMIAPISPGLLDMLLALSLALSLTVLVVAAASRRPLDFSAFPTVLLGATLLRLSLNVASTRLILLHGERGPGAAGVVIESFGRAVVGGNYAVGVVVFVVLAIINFAVVTKGASRVAEVAARFALDAMPGKQMAIDADLNAGMIGEEESRRRRRELAREGDFYAAMDGIGKFVRGDAVAAILIMAINLVAGLFIGVFEKGLTLSAALHTYTVLTVGDGLATQIPALLTSTAAGIIVAHAGSDSDLAQSIGHELLRSPGTLLGTAGLLGLLALTPGLPHLPFILMAATLAALARRGRLIAAAAISEAPAAAKAAAGDKSSQGPWPEPIRIELGAALVPFVNEPWKLVERIQALRPKLRDELGLTLPAVRLADNLALEPNSYRILVRATEVARSQLRPTMSLAIAGSRGPHQSVQGLAAVEPAFGLPALWLTTEQATNARLRGYTVVDALTALVTHFAEVVRSHGAEILTRKETETMLEQAQKVVPRIVEELSGLNIHLGTVHRVLQLLLSQRVAIRDLPVILEALAAEGAAAKEPSELAERIRPRLGRIICEPLRRSDGTLAVILLDPALEEPLFAALAAEQPIPADPEVIQRLTEAIQRAVEGSAASAEAPVIVVSPQVRRMFELVARRVSRHLTVLGATDIPAYVTPVVVGRIK